MVISNNGLVLSCHCTVSFSYQPLGLVVSLFISDGVVLTFMWCYTSYFYVSESESGATHSFHKPLDAVIGKLLLFWGLIHCGTLITPKYVYP